MAAVDRLHVRQPLLLGEARGIAHAHHHVVAQLLGPGDRLAGVLDEHRLELGHPRLVSRVVAGRQPPRLEAGLAAPSGESPNYEGEHEDDRERDHHDPKEFSHRDLQAAPPRD